LYLYFKKYIEVKQQQKLFSTGGVVSRVRLRPYSCKFQRTPTRRLDHRSMLQLYGRSHDSASLAWHDTMRRCAVYRMIPTECLAVMAQIRTPEPGESNCRTSPRLNTSARFSQATRPFPLRGSKHLASILAAVCPITMKHMTRCSGPWKRCASPRPTRASQRRCATNRKRITLLVPGFRSPRRSVWSVAVPA
jgi:hypothetical protein